MCTVEVVHKPRPTDTDSTSSVTLSANMECKDRNIPILPIDRNFCRLKLTAPPTNCTENLKKNKANFVHLRKLVRSAGIYFSYLPQSVKGPPLEGPK